MRGLPADQLRTSWSASVASGAHDDQISRPAEKPSIACSVDGSRATPDGISVIDGATTRLAGDCLLAERTGSQEPKRARCTRGAAYRTPPPRGPPSPPARAPAAPRACCPAPLSD